MENEEKFYKFADNINYDDRWRIAHGDGPKAAEIDRFVATQRPKLSLFNTISQSLKSLAAYGGMPPLFLSYPDSYNDTSTRRQYEDELIIRIREITPK
jgi:hypothetical protein